ncbi:MAG: hypothetical protein OEV38_20285 [Nitrospira sp.]|nr:hypothetical protein [Nitrospira sp.]MDH4356958.1 hypothetical protein [Nitrospira sp.]MDH5318927.1 hypothetical protein [Nitrospira sp.]
MPFERGRLKTGGRQRGSPNKSTQKVRRLCREVLETEEFQHKWRQYFANTSLDEIEPKLLTLAFHYAYGRPREQIQLSGMDSDTPSPKIVFYIPDNGRQLP